MWGRYWGPGFYGWQISRFSIISRNGPNERFLFTDFKNPGKVPNDYPENVILNFTLVDFQIAEYKEITVADPTGAETNNNIFPETDTIVIEGRHLEWVIYRALPPEGKLNSHTKSDKFSRSVGGTTVSSETWENSPEYVPLTLFTKDIRIEMYIEGDSNNVCNYRDDVTGVVYPQRLIRGRIEEFNNTQIIYKLNKLNPDCKNGFVKMDISFERVLYGGRRILSCTARTPFNNFGSSITTEYS
jgi:hypothetical protein